MSGKSARPSARPPALAGIITLLTLLALAPAPAHAVGERTKRWDTGAFDAAFTVNWLKRNTLEMGGWLRDTGCDGKGVYLDSMWLARKNRAGNWQRIEASWYLGVEDVDGCNNGKVRQPTYKYFHSERKRVPGVALRICSRDAGSAGPEACYTKYWDNPLVG